MSRYQLALVGATVALAAGVLGAGQRLGNVWAVLGLALVAATAERGRVRLGENIEASISLIPTVFAAAVFGPLAAMVVGSASFAGEFPRLLPSSRRDAVLARGAPYLRWGIYTCIRALSGGMAGTAAWAAVAVVGARTTGVVVATLAAAVVAEPLDVAFASLTMRLRGGRGAEVVKALGPVAIASIPLYTPIVALLGVAYLQVSPWSLALFFVPALAAQRLFALYQSQRELAEGLVGMNVQLERANLSFASALVATLDARDRYTAGHSAAVSIYARDIAARMGLDEQQQQLAHLCGLVHDIGKIGLPAGLLEKPGALTLEERREMQRHSEIGEKILANVETYAEIAAVVRHHHERVDGQGYPDGLRGSEMPVLSRIIAVADAYNAMTSDRPYRDAMPSRVARLRLAQAVETQFDTAVVAAFEAILAGADEDYRLAHGSEFQLLVSTSETLDLVRFAAISA
ncbi:MAG: HD-GYP domain-containing protein [Gemmatimonadota bacterium]|nr:HD-GYP domain-containing protein [Gemmatimonadota bacterium]